MYSIIRPRGSLPWASPGYSSGVRIEMPPASEENVAVSRLTVTRSSWRTTFQKPWAPG